MPLAVFVFRIQNPTKQKQTVSLAALMQNPVGYEPTGNNTAGQPLLRRQRQRGAA